MFTFQSTMTDKRYNIKGKEKKNQKSPEALGTFLTSNYLAVKKG